jgi:outer membrane autotransporter protein
VNFRSGVGLAQLVTLQNFTGTINTSGPTPVVSNATQIATLDPTAFAQADRTLMDFTGGVSSLIRGRLGNDIPSSSAVQAMSFDNERPTGLIGKAPAAIPVSATTIWASSFGGARTQDATDQTLRANSSAWGAVLGVDRQLRSDLLVGGFVGGGAGLGVDMNSQSVDSDYILGGAYGRFDWASHFLDFTVQGGSIGNKSSRLVANNLTPGGLDTATASYNGWYIDPELAYGLRYGLPNGYLLTPTARLRYLAGFLGGYSETGSAQNLSVGARTLQDLEERGELELSKAGSLSYGDSIKAGLHGGVIAQQRIGGTTIDTVLIGQNLAFTVPGQDSVIGGVAGAGVDYVTGKGVSVFGAVEGTVMSDRSRTGTAKAGVKVPF